MNQTFSFVSSNGVNLGVLAAGLILAFGVWRGRRDLGTSGAGEVMVATILTGFVPVLLFLLPDFARPTVGRTPAVPWSFLISGPLGLALGLVPLWVAVGWMERIRQATPPGSEPRSPRPEARQSPWIRALLFAAIAVIGLALLYGTRR